MKKSLCLCVSLFLLTLCPELFSNTQDSDAFQIYARLPVEAQLLAADIKLDELIRDWESRGETAKARKLQEAKGFLKEAVQKYEYFSEGGENVIHDPRSSSRPSPELPPLEGSPLSLLEHLQICYDNAVQTKFSIMVASVRYSEAQAKLHQSLYDSIGLMEKTIQAVEATRVWIVHWISGAGMMFSAPPEYERVPLLESDLIRLVKSKPDGIPQAAVFVRRVHLGREEEDLGPEQYRKNRIEEIRRKSQDVSDVELGESRTISGNFTTSFSYRYTWEGDPIKALVHLRRTGYVVFEVNCISLAESFNHKEADQIIKSIRML